MDAQQMNLWRSQSKLTSPPSQGDVTQLRDGKFTAKIRRIGRRRCVRFNSAAGKEGGPNLAARIIGHGATQAGAATANYLGLGLSPEVAAIAHPALASATEMALPDAWLWCRAGKGRASQRLSGADRLAAKCQRRRIGDISSVAIRG